jgi:Zn-dependent M28 family amino/carboxypeptidase
MHSAWRSAVVGVLGLWASGPAFASPPADEVVAQIDQGSYQYILDELLYTHMGDNRGIKGPEHNLARDNINAQFIGFGLDTHLETLIYGGNTGFNIVAELTGTTRPDEIYIIGAHYDSVKNPGADDNASGVAGIIEMARVISQYESEATIRFIAFDMEEIGLIGSKNYNALHKHENIAAMISMDMIAYDPGDNRRATLYGRTEPIKQALAGALLEYGGIGASIEGELDRSDHAPFDRRGVPACLLIEYDSWSNPHYHRQTDSVDTPGYINYTYATDMTRGVAGWLVDAAGVLAFCAADFNADGAVDTLDVLTFLNAWNAGDPEADVNGDGQINSLDALSFLNLWAAGC